MNKEEQDAIERIKESLTEFSDSRMAQYILSTDLKILIQLVEKCAKK